jgi:hypothetical protein
MLTYADVCSRYVCALSGDGNVRIPPPSLLFAQVYMCMCVWVRGLVLDVGDVVYVYTYILTLPRMQN